MARKNIFDILAEENNMSKESTRIISLFENRYTIERNYDGKRSTLKGFADGIVFEKWKSKGHHIDLDDFLDSINYNYISRAAKHDVDKFLLLIELVYNIWRIVLNYVMTYDSVFELLDAFYQLENIMKDCLANLNHTTYYDEETERTYVIEDKPAVTAVAEIVEAEDALSIIRYNHHALKGDIKAKKHILVEIGKKLEPERNRLHTINSSLEDKIFFMLNNMDLRHNNRYEGDRNYKAAVAQMADEELETWYDELYQMMLLAFLELDQSDRSEKIDALKAKITGGTT